MSPTKYIIASAALISLASCSIYKSPDRKDFESNTPSFSAQNLSFTGCSEMSVRNLASGAKLVRVENSDVNQDSVFLWEYRIQSKSVFESDNLKGTYCLYENN